jgi:hypothetical protein
LGRHEVYSRSISSEALDSESIRELSFAASFVASRLPRWRGGIGRRAGLKSIDRKVVLNRTPPPAKSCVSNRMKNKKPLWFLWCFVALPLSCMAVWFIDSLALGGLFYASSVISAAAWRVLVIILSIFGFTFGIYLGIGIAFRRIKTPPQFK